MDSFDNFLSNLDLNRTNSAIEKPPELTHPFYPGDRTYYVSDERLRAFRQLTPEQKLRWVEELATFLRMAKIGREQQKTLKPG